MNAIFQSVGVDDGSGLHILVPQGIEDMSMVHLRMSHVHLRGTKAALPDCQHWPQVPLRAWIGAS